MAGDPHMIVRDATPEDARRIAVIHVDSWRAAYQGIMPDAVLRDLSVDERCAFWSGEIARAARQTIVVATGADLVGWAGFGASRDAEAAGLGEVYGIYLDPAHYRQGLGTALWSEARRRLAAQGYRELIVWVLSANAPARRFYETMGGRVEAGVEKKFTSDGVQLQEIRYRCPCG